MDTEKVIQDLTRRFAAPLPEYAHRRIIFWNDEGREFEDRLKDIRLENAKVVVLTGNNTFMIKKLLSYDDLTNNYLVYNPLIFEKPDDDWLLDIKLYSEEFRADLISIWLDEMGIPSSITMRKLVKHYRKFFNAKERREKVSGQNPVPVTPTQLNLAVMGVLCGTKDARPDRILQCVLCANLDEEINPVYQKLVNYNIQDAFWEMVHQETGYDEENGNLEQLAIYILLTAAAHTLPPEYLRKWKHSFAITHQAYCYDFVSDWLHSEEKQKLYEIARYVEKKIALPQLIQKMMPEDLQNTECFPCVDEIILTKLMMDIRNRIIDAERIARIVERRRTCAWYKEFSDFYSGVMQVGYMQEFFRKHFAGFHAARAFEVWKNYTEDYYRMDQYYRHFYLYFQRSLSSTYRLLSDLFKHVADWVEGLYEQWFLKELGENWSNVCGEELAQYGKILGVPCQRDFYVSRVKEASSRVFVIISDAMRYEVAATLAEELQRETQSRVKLDHMQGIFPSITKFGMAALLPHQKLSVELRNNVLMVLADNQSTVNRDKVLKEANTASVALKYKDIIGMKRGERSALVKGMEVVYIYHDTIDEASHVSDTSVFAACEQAIAELKNMVRIIVNEFGGTHILITADHGFLYTYKSLTEDNKVDKMNFNGMAVEYGRRYAIMRKGTIPNYLMPVKLLDGGSEFAGFTPRENIRIKMNGGSMNFVHGGISLQEIVVPVIDYHYLRNSSMEYKRNKQKYDTKPVELCLLSSSRKISNRSFSLNFYQKDTVGANREAAVYRIYFSDSEGKQISDMQKIIADKKTDSAMERTFRCNFSLKPMKYSNIATYYLVIEEESGLRHSQHEEFQIDIVLGEDELSSFR